METLRDRKMGHLVQKKQTHDDSEPLAEKSWDTFFWWASSQENSIHFWRTVSGSGSDLLSFPGSPLIPHREPTAIKWFDSLNCNGAPSSLSTKFTQFSVQVPLFPPWNHPKHSNTTSCKNSEPPAFHKTFCLRNTGQDNLPLTIKPLPQMLRTYEGLQKVHGNGTKDKFILLLKTEIHV